MRRMFFIVLLVLPLSGCWLQDVFFGFSGPRGVQFSTDVGGEAEITQAYRDRQSGFMVEFSAPVIKMLADDNDGSRHQRFLVRLSDGQTLLVSHNIDLAPRIESLRSGDMVEVYGQYEWNDKGGVIHWTHHDPQGRHEAGWIEHNGRRYQ